MNWLLFIKKLHTHGFESRDELLNHKQKNPEVKDFQEEEGCRAPIFSLGHPSEIGFHRSSIVKEINGI